MVLKLQFILMMGLWQFQVFGEPCMRVHLSRETYIERAGPVVNMGKSVWVHLT